MAKTTVVVVDDSALVRSILTEIINRQPDMVCIGAAADPLLAREMIRELNPDVITLDVEMLDGLLTRHEDSLMVLAAPAHPDSRERVTPQLVSRMIRTLRETFDFVVIDTAPAFDEQVLTALDETDEVVLVATLDVPTLKNVKIALETFDMLHIATDRRHLLLNRADDLVGINADKVEGILGMSVAAEVCTSLAVAAATNAGTPIILSDPGHQMSVAIRDLATELAGVPLHAPVLGSTGPEPGHQSRLGRRLRRWK